MTKSLLLERVIREHALLHFHPRSMRGHYLYRTEFGTFSIRFQSAGHWHIFLEGEDLGGYATPEEAVAALSRQHYFWKASGIDPEAVGLPASLSRWELGF